MWETLRMVWKALATYLPTGTRNAVDSFINNWVTSLRETQLSIKQPLSELRLFRQMICVHVDGFLPKHALINCLNDENVHAHENMF